MVTLNQRYATCGTRAVLLHGTQSWGSFQDLDVPLGPGGLRRLPAASLEVLQECLMCSHSLACSLQAATDLRGAERGRCRYDGGVAELVESRGVKSSREMIAMAHEE